MQMPTAKLLLSASTEILGARVSAASPDDPSRGQVLSIEDIFEASFNEGKDVSESHKTSFSVNVTTLPSRKCYRLEVCPEDTIGLLKERIEETENIPANRISFLHSGNYTHDDQTLAEAGIGSCSNLHMLLNNMGAHFRLDLSELAPEFDYDFRKEKQKFGERYKRGGHEYHRPYGWYRVAIKVHGKYENDVWLGPNGLRKSSAQGEWPVSYHGTYRKFADEILKYGLLAGKRARYGRGVYSSPSLDVVTRMYARSFDLDGKTYKIIFQNRVNPTRGHLIRVSKWETGVGAEYWLSSSHNPSGNQFDIRPYGILFKEK